MIRFDVIEWGDWLKPKNRILFVFFVILGLYVKFFSVFAGYYLNFLYICKNNIFSTRIFFESHFLLITNKCHIERTMDKKFVQISAIFSLAL